MRRRTQAALAAAATVGLTAVTALAAPSLAPSLAPSASAQELRHFEGCEELRHWYVDAALPMVGPWGLEAPMYGDRVPLSAQRAATDTAASGQQAVGNGSTGTNLQEAGVDEPDVAKTNGSLVVHLESRHLLVTDVSGAEPRELSRTRLPHRLGEPNLLLVGDTVLVFGSGQSPHVSTSDLRVVPTGDTGSTRIIALDISDPTAPVIGHDSRIEGNLVSAREYDGTVRAVVASGGPSLDFVHPTRKRSVAEARRTNRQLVRSSTIEDWLPRADDGSGPGPLLDCTDVRHPEEHSGPGTLSVVTFDAHDPAARSVTAVTAGGELVYSSADRLYIATHHGGSGGPVPLVRDESVPGAASRFAPPSTQVHAFALDGAETEYVASGDVPGTVADRWSFDEQDGHLRVATALGRNPWNPRENAVVVLDERAGQLVQVGRVDGIGVREQIRSVRWLGDLAVVVTFRQVDPLYTVDLSDPAGPTVLGELKIPGFSSYLHPIGDDRLLGLGQDATLRGRTKGAQAAVFDISELADPRRVDTVGFDRNTEFAVAWDTRAFTYLPGPGVALTPVQNWRGGDTRVAVVRVREDGTLTRRLTDRVAGWDASGVRALPLDEDRVAVVSAGEVSLLSVP